MTSSEIPLAKVPNGATFKLRDYRWRKGGQGIRVITPDGKELRYSWTAQIPDDAVCVDVEERKVEAAKGVGGGEVGLHG